MKIEAITKESVGQYKSLILPYIYDEFAGGCEETDTEYFGLVALIEPGEEGFEEAKEFMGAVSVLIIQPEATGDLNIVSIYTLPRFRRKGYASALTGKAIQVARTMFQWDEGETEDLVIFKTLYRLPEDIQEIYEAFLIKNHFTDFVELESEEGIHAVSASAYLRFFREI